MRYTHTMRITAINNTHARVQGTTFGGRKQQPKFYSNLTGNREKDQNPKIPLGAYFNPVIKTTIKDSKERASLIQQRAQAIVNDSKTFFQNSQEAKEKAIRHTDRIVEATQEATREIAEAKSRNDFSTYSKPDGTLVTFVSKEDSLAVIHIKDEKVQFGVTFYKTGEVETLLRNEENADYMDMSRVANNSMLIAIKTDSPALKNLSFDEEYCFEGGNLVKYSKNIDEKGTRGRLEGETYFYENNQLSSYTQNLQIEKGCSIHQKNFTYDKQGNIRVYSTGTLIDSKGFKREDEYFVFEGKNDGKNFAFVNSDLRVVYQDGKLSSFQDNGIGFSNNKKDPKTQLIFEDGKLKAYYVKNS